MDPNMRYRLNRFTVSPIYEMSNIHIRYLSSPLQVTGIGNVRTMLKLFRRKRTFRRGRHGLQLRTDARLVEFTSVVLRFYEALVNASSKKKRHMLYGSVMVR